MHLVWVVDIDLGVELCLFNFQFCIYQRDLGVIDSFRHLGVCKLLVHHYASDQFCFAEAFAVLLEHLDQINVRLQSALALFSNLSDGLDGYVCE